MGISDILSVPIAAFFLFGGLLFWPVFRGRIKPDTQRAIYLRRVFHVHIVAVLSSLALVTLAAWARTSDWHHLLAVPFFIGAISPIASILVLLFASKNPEVNSGA